MSVIDEIKMEWTGMTPGHVIAFYKDDQQRGTATEQLEAELNLIIADRIKAARAEWEAERREVEWTDAENDQLRILAEMLKRSREHSGVVVTPSDRQAI